MKPKYLYRNFFYTLLLIKIFIQVCDLHKLLCGNLNFDITKSYLNLIECYIEVKLLL